MIQYAIYDSPRDHPGWFVVRPWLISGAVPQPHLIGCLCHTLEEAQRPFAAAGLVRLPRHPSDDAVIVEVWL